MNWTTFAWRAVAAHTATYLLCGLVAQWLFGYADLWSTPAFAHFRPLDSPWVAMGPASQVLRGLVLAAVLWPFRAAVLEAPRGGLKLWALLVGIGIVSPYGAAPGSLEGFVYLDMPAVSHLRGLPEVIAQSGLFSAAMVGWHARPSRAWGVVLGGVMGLAVLTGILGVVFGPAAA